MEPTTVDAFFKIVEQAGLIDAARCEALRDSIPPEERKDPRTVADYLVRKGWLSRFQADKLQKGVTLGLVLGAFHILSPTGKGGMGAVYLARDSRNHALVALKVLPPKQAKARERLLARFRREMEISQRVAHPHITRTLEVGVHEGINYIAMEYIPGRNLYRVVNEQGPLPVQRAARMFCEVALGLAHAHSQGLIHRDLKPSNIMVMPDDHVKVLDLGLALMQGEEEGERNLKGGGAGYIVGTLDYLAPEQAGDPLKVDARTDIYSLGCALYFALTGRPPFPGGTPAQKLLRHRVDQPAPINQLNQAVPAEFAGLIAKMMAKKPAQRFSSADEVRQVLAPWLPEDGSADRPITGLNPEDPLPVAKLQNTGRPDAEAVPLVSTTPGLAAPTGKVPVPAALQPTPAAGGGPAAKLVDAPAAKPASAPAAAAAAAPAQPRAAPALAAVTPPKPAAFAASPAPAAGAHSAAGGPAVVLADPLTPPAASRPAVLGAPPARAQAAPAVAPSQPPAGQQRPAPQPAPTPRQRPQRETPPPPPAPTAADADNKENTGSSVDTPQQQVPMAQVVEEVPFWLDYLLPVGSGSLFLLILWILMLVMVFR